MPSQLFKITKAVSTIEFNTKGQYKKLKIARFAYKTGSVNNYFALVRMDGWNRYGSYDSTDAVGFITLPNAIDSTQNYLNRYSDVFDVKQDVPKDIGTHTLEIYINNSRSNTDISIYNPVYIEFYYE